LDVSPRWTQIDDGVHHQIDDGVVQLDNWLDDGVDLGTEMGKTANLFLF